MTIRPEGVTEAEGKRAKHTPGPWKAHRHSGNSGAYFVHQSPTGTEVVASGVNGANARLIAAAPELLEALQNLVFECSQDEEHTTAPGVFVLEHAIAAIAKATREGV